MRTRQAFAVAAAAGLTTTVVVGVTSLSHAYGHSGSESGNHVAAAVGTPKPQPTFTAGNPNKPSPPAAAHNAPCRPQVSRGAIAPFVQGPFGQSQYFTTVTSFEASDGYPYQVYAGAEGDDANAGEVIIVRMPQDQCNGDYDGVLKTVKDVTPDGADTLISVSGDVVTLRTSGGTTHTVDVVKQGPDAGPQN